jgi:uncharacterized membrane-anchored protein
LLRIAAFALLLGSLGTAALAASPAPAGVETPDRVLATVLRESIGGPARADLGEQASVRLDKDLLVVPRQPAIRLLGVLNRAVPDDLVGLLVGSEGFDAAGTITFTPAGFIDSDAAIAWTADDILASLRRTIEQQNPARLQQGLQPLEARRWVLAPSYNPEKHEMSWAALVIPTSAPRDSDGEVTFHAIQFGREGYVQLSVVASEQKAEPIKEMVAGFLNGLNFQPGKAYADFQPGDRRSASGLAGAMGIQALAKAETDSKVWSSDSVVPLAGGIVAAIGAIALLLNIHRTMRRNSRRV